MHADADISKESKMKKGVYELNALVVVIKGLDIHFF